MSKSPDLKHGSDVEIASAIALNFRKQYAGNVLHCDGEFWCYAGTCWEALPRLDIQKEIKRWDGKHIGDHVVGLNMTRINSIVGCLAIELERVGFFGSPALGINCQNGFIKFDDGVPKLIPHSSEHRQRFVIGAEWQPRKDSDLLPECSLLRKLLFGSFDNDPERPEKIALLGEVAGCVALGYGYSHARCQPSLVQNHGNNGPTLRFVQYIEVRILSSRRRFSHGFARRVRYQPAPLA